MVVAAACGATLHVFLFFFGGCQTGRIVWEGEAVAAGFLGDESMAELNDFPGWTDEEGAVDFEDVGCLLNAWFRSHHQPSYRSDVTISRCCESGVTSGFFLCRNGVTTGL
jgi:hypothetical protein